MKGESTLTPTTPEERLPLTFKQLREANDARNEHPAFKFPPPWTASDWACAMAGECGEACNFVKKLRRGEPVDIKKIAKELADMVTYGDRLAKLLGIDLGEAIRDKFNEVSIRRGVDFRL